MIYFKSVFNANATYVSLFENGNMFLSHYNNE